MTIEKSSDSEVSRNLEQILSSNATVLARLNSHLQSLIPVFVEEFADNQAPEATTSVLEWRAERDTYFRCTGIYVSVPDGTESATLQLGELRLELANQVTLLAPVQRILTSRDARTLTYTTGADNGGNAKVWLWGEAVPKYGKM